MQQTVLDAWMAADRRRQELAARGGSAERPIEIVEGDRKSAIAAAKQGDGNKIPAQIAPPKKRRQRRREGGLARRRNPHGGRRRRIPPRELAALIEGCSWEKW